MSALAVYFGAQNTSLLLEHTSGYIEFFNFPYVYSPELFSNYSDQANFYKSFLEQFLKDRKLKLTDVDLLSTGFIESPKLWTDKVFSRPLMDIINSFSDFYPIMVNNFSVVTKDQFCSVIPLSGNEAKINTKLDNEELDYYTNLSIYPQLVPNDLAMQMDIDEAIVKSMTAEPLRLPQDRPLIFTGTRFSQLIAYPELNYIFMFNLIRSPGFYELYMDRNNASILLQLLRLNRKDFDMALKSRVESVGTLISTRGTTECLLTSDIGTSQFFEIEDNGIFIIPLDKDTYATLSVKNKDVGTIEKKVRGGRIGLIFDTREDKSNITSEVKIFNTCMKQLNQILCSDGGKTC